MKDRRTMVRQLADVVKISVEPFMSTLNIVSPEDSSDAHTFSEVGTTVNCSQPFYQKNQDETWVHLYDPEICIRKHRASLYMSLLLSGSLYFLFRSKLKIHKIIINIFLIVIVKLVKLINGTVYLVRKLILYNIL